MITPEQEQQMREQQNKNDELMAKIIANGHVCAYELESYPSQVCWCRKHDVCDKINSASSGFISSIVNKLTQNIQTKFTETSYCDFCEKVPCVQIELEKIKLIHPCAIQHGIKVVTCEKDLCICEEIKHINSHVNCAKIAYNHNKQLMIIDTCEQENCLGDIVLRMKNDGHSCGFIDYNNKTINWCETKNKCRNCVVHYCNGFKPKQYDD
jgi:hypothetical protein